MVAIRPEVAQALIDNEEQWYKLLSVIDKESSTVIPFDPSPIQLAYVRKRNLPEHKRRRVTVKTRQVFMSTIILAKNFRDVVTVPGTRVLVLTHHEDATKLMRLTVKYWCDQLAEIGMLPEIENDNDNLLAFKKLQSFIVFQTAGGKFGGRSTSFNRVHLSEVAFWQGDPYKILGGLIPTLPQDAEVDMESSPQGAEGPLHDYYIDAKAGDNEWEPVFIPWYVDPLKVREVPDGFKYTVVEESKAKEFGLTPEQVAWRRWMVSEMRRTAAKGESGLFEQEYPEDDISCFLAGADTVLEAADLEVYRRMIAEPLVHMHEWDIWEAPVTSTPYILVCDPSEGKVDFTAAHVFDVVRLKQVARLHLRTHPSHAAELLDWAARQYNNALVVVETPGPGGRVLDQLILGLGYTNVYYYYDEISGAVREDPGWPQNTKTRTDVIDALQTHTHAHSFAVQDERTVREMASLTWRKAGNMRRSRAEAGVGAHDDLVLALGILLMTFKDALVAYRKTRGVDWGEGYAALPLGGGPSPSTDNGYTVLRVGY